MMIAMYFNSDLRNIAVNNNITEDRNDNRNTYIRTYIQMHTHV